MLRRAPFTPRRRALLALVLLVLAWLGWSWWAGMAITAGLERAQMDWNGDGVTTGQELWQAVHAVRVVKTVDGNRHCQQFSWTADDAVIRVDCRTQLQPAP
ncbi:MAG: EF-hand domain-containing protein [Stenotrophomonas sp.]